MSTYDLQLNCHRCGDFTEPIKRKDDPDTVVRCGGCGKKHSEGSIYFIDMNREYNRSEDGVLLDRLP